MHISTKGRYGLRALLDLAIHGNDGPVTLASIARRQHISEGYLEQIMMPMKRHGLVTSIRGSKGGYLLARPPAQILAGEAFEVLEGAVSLSDCIGQGDGFCGRESDCLTRPLWQELHESIRGILFSYSLADLLEKKQPNQ